MDAGINMKEFMVSSTVGRLNNTFITDLTYEETRQTQAELIISYFPRKKEVDFVELKCQKIQMKDYEKLMSIACQSC